MRLPALGARLGAITALAVLAACAHQAGQSGPASAPSGSATGQVGYVSLDRLVKKHPMYGQLASYDADIQALQLKAVTSSVAVSPADLERAKVELQQELNAAVARTKATLKDKADDMQTRENAAIAAALGAAAPSGGSISGGINQQLASQQQHVRDEAAKDFDAYRKQVIAQDQVSLKSLEESYNARASREYRAKANALQGTEAAFALKLADDDKADRLSLRTKLSNLPLDTEREATRAQLDAIDRKEADQLGQMRNRDQQTLSDLQATLRTRVKGEVDVAVASIKQKSVAKIDAHLKATQQLVDAASGGVVTQSGSSASLPPDMQARIKSLQDKFQQDFNAERDRTLADLDKTRHDLSIKFEHLTGVDREADASTQKEITKLQKTRTDLYDSMTAEIQREIRIVAQKRGIDVVFSDVVAPAGGVDLTSDAEKDIESLPK